MALPTYNVEYVEIDKNGIKTVNCERMGVLSTPKIVKGMARLISDVLRGEKYALYNTYICSTYNNKFSLLYIHVGSWAISFSISVHFYIYIRQQRVVRQRELHVFLKMGRKRDM